VHIAVVSVASTSAHARLTVRHALAVAGYPVTVLDVDGTYRPVGDETVLGPADVGLTAPEVHRRAALLLPSRLGSSCAPALVRALDAGTVLSLAPGVVLLAAPVPFADADHELVLVARSAGLRAAGHPAGGPRPDVTDLAGSGSFSPAVIAVGRSRGDVLDVWEQALLAPGRDAADARWLDAVAALVPHAAVRAASALVSSWNVGPSQRFAIDGTLRVDGEPVTALDLTELGAATPWQLGPPRWESPRARLSEHPALAEVVESLADELAADDPPADPFARTSLGTPVDDTLRTVYRDADRTGSATVDPFDPARREELLDWLAAPTAGDGPGRYLLALRESRADLVASFPDVPGAGSPAFLAWVAAHAVGEGHPAELVEESLRRVPPAQAERGRRAPGVNVVGFLRGELGIGESARLLTSALTSAGVPVRTVTVETGLASRQRVATAPVAGTDRLFDTSIVCVNADLTPRVLASVPEVVDRSFRIGMWYWEVEQFPASQHGGFARLDEVWVATDFVRQAVQPHSPVPVRTLTPPLPQRGPAPARTRADLGWPDRPVFLFAFDFLSTAERKNPWGLVDAFVEAFTPDDGPVLVLKSINAERRPSDAERLRRRVAGLEHVILDERYLEPAERDAMMAHADCYVSLHRSEGLGLTMAEAMAWGKPVVATGYSGNLQFMTPENSFLVPSSPVTIGPGAEPYPPAGVWADPDLDAAARLLRLVVDDPDLAARRGARAAADIATLHSAEAAGRAMAARLSELAPSRRARSRTTLRDRAERAARAMLAASRR